MQKKYDVIIVGGGPAGLACALELANSKYSVLLLDRKKILGDKPCGGGICEKEVAVKYEPSFVKVIEKQEVVLNNFSINLVNISISAWIKPKNINGGRQDIIAKFTGIGGYTPYCRLKDILLDSGNISKMNCKKGITRKEKQIRDTIEEKGW